mmetsp:Transcript_16535/g.53522  ORF Transcript_16535/g.53522 Transcript_16535/m.53522 type:complete len:245 (+) Transcript_16535:578-1312(+)
MGREGERDQQGARRVRGAWRGERTVAESRSSEYAGDDAPLPPSHGCLLGQRQPHNVGRGDDAHEPADRVDHAQPVVPRLEHARRRLLHRRRLLDAGRRARHCRRDRLRLNLAQPHRVLRVPHARRALATELERGAAGDLVQQVRLGEDTDDFAVVQDGRAGDPGGVEDARRRHQVVLGLEEYDVSLHEARHDLIVARPVLLLPAHEAEPRGPLGEQAGLRRARGTTAQRRPRGGERDQSGGRPQ